MCTSFFLFIARVGPLGASDVEQLCSGRRFQDGHFDLDGIMHVLSLAVNTLFFLTAAVAASLQNGACETVAHSIQLGQRLPRGGVPGGVPGVNLIRRVRTRLGVARSRPMMGPKTYAEWKVDYDAELLRLPTGRRALHRKPDGTTIADEDATRVDVDPPSR